MKIHTREMRKQILHLITVLCFLVGFNTSYAAEKTNVVFILTDNHGAWTLGCYGNPDIRTPNIDRMADEGIRFTQAFCNNAVCSPTRATYLTGLMPSQHGVHNFLSAGRLQIGPEARSTMEAFTTFPEVLKSEGYKCGLVGKWHLGANHQPQEGLEDYWITMPHGGTRTFHNAEVIENGETRTEPTYLTQLWTDRACEFIESNQEEPFFLYLAYNGPYGLSGYQMESSGNRHADYYADKPLDSFPRGAIHPWQYSNRQYFGNDVSIRRYAEELSAIDDGVGTVLQKLQELGLDENTLVVFAADQGWAGGQHGLWGMGDHTRPVNAFEHSMRIPLIFRHPAGIDGGRTSELMVSNYDFMTSVLGYLGLEERASDSPKSPGRDYSAVLRNQPVGVWENAVFYEYETLRCIRTEDWKYIERFEDGYDELYHLATDPMEQINLISNETVADKKTGLQARLNQFFDQYTSPEYDLWKGGGSQTRTHVWGKEAAERHANRATQSGQLPSAINLSVTVPPMTLPNGLVAEVAAAPPLTRHPMMGHFDIRGRLFVAEAAGVNRKAEELEVEKPNFIRMLVDQNQDGRFDESTIFADDLTFPSGALWHEGALWVTAAPSIWRFEDTNDDGVADKREEVVTGFGYTGNAADLHGPFLHPNGRIFWCHGRKDLDVHDKDGKRIHTGKGARIWSCEPDGSDVQIYAGGGMDNPVEIVFTPEGEIIGDINLMYGRPRGDTLVHWQYGGAYPRYDQEAVLAEFKRTGDLLTEFHNFGHVAVSGINLYRSQSGLGDFAGNLFTTHFNTQKITRSILEKDGATFRHVDEEDFLTIDDPDVHLTDVIEAANGDLLVVDTGGWFRNGCPVSQIAKPEIAGAIYRIRKAGARDKKTDFHGFEIDWGNSSAPELVKLLDDERFAVQDRAIAELAKRGKKSLEALGTTLSSGSVAARRNAVWVLTRIGSAKAKQLVRMTLADVDESIRHTACNSIWRTRDINAVDQLKKLLLTDESPAVQMAAARALGRIGDISAVPDLLTFISRSMDRVTEHAAIYALIELNDFETTSTGLRNRSSNAQRRTLWALNGMRNFSLGVDQVLRALDQASQAMVKTVVSLCKLHPEWADGTAQVFHSWKDSGRLNPQQKLVVNQLAPYFLTTREMQSFVGRFLESKDWTDSVQVFELISKSPHKVDLHPSWESDIESALWSGHIQTLSFALDALLKIETDEFDYQLRKIAARDHPNLVRIKALNAVSDSSGPLNSEAFTLLIEILSSSSGSDQRMDIGNILSNARLEAANILSKSKLTKTQLLEVVSLVRNAGPLELPLLVDVFTKTRDSATGFALVDALESSLSTNALSPSELQRMLARYQPEVSDHAKPLVKKLFAQDELREDRLAEMGQALEAGNSQAGRQVFLSGKGACITCHKVGEDGREAGPDLSHIGQLRTKADLLESILFPSTSLARDFEPYQIETVDDQSHFGIIQRETSDTVHLIDASGTGYPIPRASIKTIQPGPVSLMPQGLDQTMTEQELLDIIAYLDSLE